MNQGIYFRSVSYPVSPVPVLCVDAHTSKPARPVFSGHIHGACSLMSADHTHACFTLCRRRRQDLAPSARPFLIKGHTVLRHPTSGSLTFTFAPLVSWSLVVTQARPPSSSTCWAATTRGPTSARSPPPTALSPSSTAWRSGEFLGTRSRCSPTSRTRYGEILFKGKPEREDRPGAVRPPSAAWVS